MCGKYVLLVGNEPENTKILVEICNNGREESQQISLEKSADIVPGNNAPALLVANGQICAKAMRWGFDKDGSPLLINARSEDVRDRRTFKNLLDGRRCALPAGGYYEWRDTDHVRHLISRKDGKAIYLAGLYRLDEKLNPQFVVMTRNAYGEHADIHDRMPCIMYSREEARRWITGGMQPEEFLRRKTDELCIVAQEAEQLRMVFAD